MASVVSACWEGEAHLRTSPPRQGLADYLDGYHNQVNICLQNEVPGSSPDSSPQLRWLRFLNAVTRVQNSQYKTVERVVQTLKNLCCALDEVETRTVTEAVKRLRHAANVPRTHSPKVGCDAVVDPLPGHVWALTEMLCFVDGVEITWTIIKW